jgi:hypothetical protein
LVLPSLDLQHVTPNALAACGQHLQTLGEGATHRQAAAERVVSFVYENFRRGDTDEPGCVLVRCFQTCPYARLPLEYQFAADGLLDLSPSNRGMRCLALLATRGSKLVWNDVATSIHHQCIPLPSVEVLNRAPMIARLLEQLGVPLESVVAPPDSPDFVLDQTPGGFNVFHVECALGSPAIPAQDDFVAPYNVQSVVGMGGVLPDGELFVVLLFTRVPILHETADLLRSLAPSVRAALLPFTADETFEKPGSLEQG